VKGALYKPETQPLNQSIQSVRTFGKAASSVDTLNLCYLDYSGFDPFVCINTKQHTDFREKTVEEKEKG
jgi:hypothetical protein